MADHEHEEYAPADHEHHNMSAQSEAVTERLLISLERLSERVERLESKLYEEQQNRESQDYHLDRKIDNVQREARRSSAGW